MKLILTICNLVLIYMCVVNSQECFKIDTCRCNSTLGLIDLNPLTSTETGEPRFKNVLEETGTYWYSFSPCTSFTQSSCVGVAGCKTDNSTFYTIGTQDSFNFFSDERGLSLTYVANKDIPRSMRVFLDCDPNEDGRLNVTGENPVGSQKYEMILTSKYCCFINDDPTTVPTTTTVATTTVATTTAATTTAEPDTTSGEPETTSVEPDTTTGSEPTEPSGSTSSGPTEPSSESTEPPASGPTEPVSGSTEPITGSSMPASATTIPETTTPTDSSQSVHTTGVIALVTSVILYKILI